MSAKVHPHARKKYYTCGKKARTNNPAKTPISFSLNERLAQEKGQSQQCTGSKEESQQQYTKQLKNNNKCRNKELMDQRKEMNRRSERTNFLKWVSWSYSRLCRMITRRLIYLACNRRILSKPLLTRKLCRIFISI